MIRSLLYLTASRLSISFSVGACSRYQEIPKESHLMSIKRIICYINGTFDYGLWYPYDYSFVIVGYFDIDWDGNVEDRKNTSSVCFFLLVIVLWLGLVRNKTLYPYPLFKLSILLLGVVIRNSCG